MYFHFFNKNKRQSRNLDDTHSISLTINKTPGLSLAKLIPRLSMIFQLSGNPDSAVSAKWRHPSVWTAYPLALLTGNGWLSFAKTQVLKHHSVLVRIRRSSYLLWWAEWWTKSWQLLTYNKTSSQSMLQLVTSKHSKLQTSINSEELTGSRRKLIYLTQDNLHT